MRLQITFILLLYINVVCSNFKKTKTVKTLLNTKWSLTPFELEACEFFSAEDRYTFWSCINYLAEFETQLSTMSDKDIYHSIIDFSKRHLSPARLKLLKFSLSLHVASPKIEMFNQVAIDRRILQKKNQTCSNNLLNFVLEVSNEIFCDFESLKHFIDNLERSPVQVELFSVDHRYPTRTTLLNSAPIVILYAHAGRPGFASIHNELKLLAEDGRVIYVLRHLLMKSSAEKVRLSGYGVELQIKSSEYKAQDDRKIVDFGSGDGMDEGTSDDGFSDEQVDGFNFKILKERYPEEAEKLSEFKEFLFDQFNDFAPLKVWQLQDLSLQAAERILMNEKENQLVALRDISQNFPSYARSLSKVTVSKELRKECSKNSDIFAQSMDFSLIESVISINGMQFDLNSVDIFTILDVLLSENRLMDGLAKLEFDKEQTRKLLAIDFSDAKETRYGIDIRDASVKWINDIERDSMYRSWPSSMDEMLRPTFPGMLRSIRRNFFNVILLFTMELHSDIAKVAGLVKLLHLFYTHQTPIRIGLVFNVPKEHEDGMTHVSAALTMAFNYVREEKSSNLEAFVFLRDVLTEMSDDEASFTAKFVHQKLKNKFDIDESEIGDIFGGDSDYNVGLSLANNFVIRAGLSGQFPHVLVNGIPLEQEKLNEINFEEVLMISLMKETSNLQRAIYSNKINNNDDALDFLMSQPFILPRLNERLLGETTKPQYLDFIGIAHTEVRQLNQFLELSLTDQVAWIADHMIYKLNKKGVKLQVITVWLVLDLDHSQGRDILRGALSHSSSQIRFGIIHNSQSENVSFIVRIVNNAIRHLNPTAVKQLFNKVLRKEATLEALELGRKKLSDYDIPGEDMTKFANLVTDDSLNEDDNILINTEFAKNVLALKPGQNALVVNGRIIGPFEPSESFGADDFNLLERLSMNFYGDKLINAFYSNFDIKSMKNSSNLAMKVVSLLLNLHDSSHRSRSEFPFFAAKHSAIVLEPPEPDLPIFEIKTVLDPASKTAQKISSILLVLKDVINARIVVCLNAATKHSEMPLKGYFRMALEPEITFAADNSISGPIVRFANLPEESILTMIWHIPDNWLIEPVNAVYDMDNIKLSNLESGLDINSVYELEYLLLEGHCFDDSSGSPPRGLQLVLGGQMGPQIDTIVMANLGYLQLKTGPGLWVLNLRDGRSAELYDIVKHEQTEGGSLDGKNIRVIVSSFKSHIIKLRVSKKPDKIHESLLMDSNDDGFQSDSDERGSFSSNIWNSIKSTLSGTSSDVIDLTDKTKDVEDKIDIFCLASGHLYERLLKIMMLSTIRNTKSRVKFWILKNYLSPALKYFLPHFARKYGFEFEFVQYKWPRWLNQQTEKQRIIWGYKILFLDVMFPLDLKKIIFVDTDQIVRADLAELRDLDLEGAPYGYTPFCDSNREMDGFRFWNQGYWKRHLAGRKYHISALYVVDLVRFRQIAAGDRLRGQYQALSQDPNSLSNLDQDLPNNMIHQVPIKSLPQEWLWCETWCDINTKQYAKSIDLCNNPLTKESKLDAARRIVSEWTDYDNEINRFQNSDIREASKGKDEL